MVFRYCPNCDKSTGHKRTLGFGTFFMVIITGGLWILIIPFYPIRCIVCGSQAIGLPKASKPSKNNKEERLDAYDDIYDEAMKFVVKKKLASISMIQRRFKVSYNRAANIIDIMEREGVVGPANGSKPREVLIAPSKDR